MNYRTIGFAAVLLAVVPGWSVAGGFTTTAVPTRIDVVRNEGFMVFGPFGNPGGCSVADQFFVRNDHVQYKQLYAMALSAYLTKQKIYAYAGYCQPWTWYAGPTTTYNTVTGGDVMYLTD